MAARSTLELSLDREGQRSACMLHVRCSQRGPSALDVAEIARSARFSQIIGSLPIQSSARFLSIETGGEANLGFRQLDAALRSIPGLGLVVLDDWAPASGPVSSDLSKGILNHISTWSSEIPHLLISTANQDASNGDEALRVRHRRELAEVGCESGS